MRTILRPALTGLLAATLFIGCTHSRSGTDDAVTRVENGATSNAANEVAQGAPRSTETSEALVDLSLSGALAPSSASRYLAKARGVRGEIGFVEPEWNTEDYSAIEENGFRLTKDHPLSTFSIDVDAASYANLRRFIHDGMAAPKDAVRIEEMVNYFSYDYPAPEGDVPFSVVTEVGPAPWNAAHRIVHIGLQGEKIDLVGRPASNLVFLLDVSGSMDEPDKLPLLKKAFRMLVGELGENDRVSIVVYAGAAGMVLEPTRGDRAEQIVEALERLQAGGSTAGAEGIQLAYSTAAAQFIEGGINRVILATDGDFNVGVSSDAELMRLIEEKRQTGVFLTVLGFGTGNIKDNKMETLADHGNGNYYYIDSELEARKVLVSELGGTLHTIAKDVKLQIEFNPALVSAYRLIGYENRMLSPEDFADDRKDAGELGAGHTVTALYEVIPVGADSPTAVRGQGDLRYQSGGLTTTAATGELMHLALRYKEPNGTASRLIERPVRAEDSRSIERTSDDFRFSAAVAAFGMILRGSEHKGDSTVPGVLALSKGSLGADVEGYRADFVRLVEAYARLRDGHPDVAGS